MDPMDVLTKATRSGVRSSEFWVTLLGLGGALFLPYADVIIGHAGDRIAQHGTAGAVAAGAIVGAYNVGRSLVKASTAKALLTPVEAPVQVTAEPAVTTRTPASTLEGR